MLASLRKFGADEVAQERLKIIEFYDSHGEAETQKYFRVNRKTIHVWKKTFEHSGHRLESLVAHSTRPNRVRRMTTDPRLMAFLRQVREEHPRLGKVKLKPLLDSYCRSLGVASLSVSTIGKVLKRHQLFFQKTGRVYHDPNSKWAEPQGRKRVRRERVRYAPHPEELGHWQLDTMVRELDRLRVYFYSAIDIQGKHAYHIPHRWSYPRCPRINGCVERYQRTLNEEFIQVHEDCIRAPREFLRHLSEYLVFYNSERVHHALGNQTPLRYLPAQRQMSRMSAPIQEVDNARRL